MSKAKRRAVGITRVAVEGNRQEARLHMTVAWIGQGRAVSGGADLANRKEDAWLPPVRAARPCSARES